MNSGDRQDDPLAGDCVQQMVIQSTNLAVPVQTRSQFPGNGQILVLSYTTGYHKLDSFQLNSLFNDIIVLSICLVGGTEKTVWRLHFCSLRMRGPSDKDTLYKVNVSKSELEQTL